ncbi:hypothetical protein [Peribacillus frigoritolerans]|uniref:hypothetical protein n=1 Tax=Peribacillus frigoritolerans TaxID=450367 RepID=UPI003F7F6D3F
MVDQNVLKNHRVKTGKQGIVHIVKGNVKQEKDAQLMCEMYKKASSLWDVVNGR